MHIKEENLTFISTSGDVDIIRPKAQKSLITHGTSIKKKKSSLFMRMHSVRTWNVSSMDQGKF